MLDESPAPTAEIATLYTSDCIITPNLEGLTTYYWQVLLQDEYGHETESDIYSFTTIIDTSIQGTVTDVDDNEYPWRRYGDQCWMTTNLRTTRYADGSAISYLPDADDWDALTEIGKRLLFL